MPTVINCCRLMLLAWLFAAPVIAAQKTGVIRNARLNSTTFNASRGETVRLTYELARPDTVTVRVYDPDGGLVATLLNGVKQSKGRHAVQWDGLDESGQVVPDEAYSFTVETKLGAVYDPAMHSSGEVGDLTEARFSEEGTVVDKLPAASRVLVRLGLHDGPMLKTLVDWKPRVAGEITEYWDGFDEDKLIRLRGEQGFTALITYVTLPDATVITYGNAKETYRDYKLN